MKILFLDDSNERTKLFLSRVPSATNAYCAKDIIKKISEQSKIDLLFLDHDLEGIFQNSAEENCGMEVVRYICKHRPKIRNIIVHSLNYPAAQEMVQKLKNAGYNSNYYSFLSLMSENNLERVLKYVTNS